MKVIRHVLLKDAITAFETAFNFLQQDSMEIDYDELRVFRSLKRRWSYIVLQAKSNLE